MYYAGALRESRGYVVQYIVLQGDSGICNTNSVHRNIGQLHLLIFMEVHIRSENW